MNDQQIDSAAIALASMTLLEDLIVLLGLAAPDLVRQFADDQAERCEDRIRRAQEAAAAGDQRAALWQQAAQIQLTAVQSAFKRIK